MAIIKIKSGKSNTENAITNGKYNFYDRSSVIKKSNKFLFNGEFIIVPGEGIFIPNYFNGKFDLHQRAYAICSNSNELLTKYLFYFIFKNKYLFYKYAVGSTVSSLRLSSFDWILNKKFPLKDTQQKIIDIIERNEKLFLKFSKCIRIDSEKHTKKDMNNLIDIIEPLENMKNNLINQLNIISKYTELLSQNFNILEKMNKSCNFIKGNSVYNSSVGKTLFLNVSAANGNPNKYCNNEANIFPTDIMLSLDGNTGLVNNNLLGFNGYLYKVSSEKFSNWQIYYSLKHDINQKIIKNNETGTTIKHSPNSKKELLLLDFKEYEILEKIFNIEIIIKKQISILEKQIQKTISILIK